MSIRDEQHGRVSVAVSIVFAACNQRPDLELGQVLTAAKFSIRLDESDQLLGFRMAGATSFRDDLFIAVSSTHICTARRSRILRAVRGGYRTVFASMPNGCSALLARPSETSSGHSSATCASGQTFATPWCTVLPLPPTPLQRVGLTGTRDIDDVRLKDPKSHVPKNKTKKQKKSSACLPTRSAYHHSRTS